MSRYNPIQVVPGDTWNFSIATVDGDGASVDLSGWTVLSAVVTGSGEPFDVTADVLAGSVQITAAAAVTAQLRYGNVSILTVRLQSVDETQLTVLSEYLNGVPVLGEEVERSVRIVGTNGYSTYELYVQAGGGLSQEAWLAAQEESRLAAEDAADRAEAARDAANVIGPKYATEALGRAAVADGVTFFVQGSGDVAAYEYRRTDSSTSVLIATYPSKALVDAKLPTATYTERFRSMDIPGLVGEAIVTRDVNGRLRLLQGTLEDGTVLDALGPRYQKTTILTSDSVLSIDMAQRDVNGRLRMIEGSILVDGEVVQISSYGAVLEIEPDEPTEIIIEPGRQHYLRAGSANLIPDAASSVWITNGRQVGNDCYIGSVSGPGEVPSSTDLSMAQLAHFKINGSMIALIASLGWHWEIDDHSPMIPIVEARVRSMPGWISRLREVAEIPLQALQVYHDPDSPICSMWRGNSRDPMKLGERAQTMVGTTLLSYGQQWRSAVTPDKIRIWIRQGSTSVRGWGVARSDKNMDDGLTYTRTFIADNNAYMLSWPMTGTETDALLWQCHPADTTTALEKKLMLVFQTVDGKQWSYAGGGPSTPFTDDCFAEGFTPTDPWALGDIIYDPVANNPYGTSYPNARCRLTSWAEVRKASEGVDAKFAACIEWFNDRAPLANYTLARKGYFEVEMNAAGPIVSAVKWYCVTGAAQLPANGYVGMSCVLREGMVACCVIRPIGGSVLTGTAAETAVTSSQSIFMVLDLRGSEPVKVPFEFGVDEFGRPKIVTEYITTNDVHRPVSCVKDVWLSSIYTHELADFSFFNEASVYVYYDDFKANQRPFKVPAFPT